jgi:ABC-type multidrug transport system fused ATPase/permease subunit
MNNDVISLLKKFYNSNKKTIIECIIFNSVNEILEIIVTPLIVSDTINNIINKNKDVVYNLIYLSSLWIIIKVINIVCLNCNTKLDPAFSKMFLKDVGEKVVDDTINNSLPISFSNFLDNSNTLRRDIKALIFDTFRLLLPYFLTSLSFSIVLFYINKNIGCVFLTLLFLIIFSLYILFKISLKNFKTELQKKDEFHDYLEDIHFNSVFVASNINNLSKENDNISNKVDIYSRIMQQSTKDIKYMQGFCVILYFIFLSIILWMSYNFYKNKDITPQNFMKIFLLLTAYSTKSSFFITGLDLTLFRITNVFKTDAFLKKIATVKNNNPDLPKLEKYDIKFDNVKFSHEKNNKLFQNLNLVISNNKISIIFGPSGIGKSSLLNLIFGVHTPEEGKIFINNNDISKYNKNSLRNNMIYIHQNSNTLFNKSVLENILYGEIENDEGKIKEIKNIMVKFNFYDIFKNLDENKDQWSFLDLQVGKNGKNLSGGQRKIIHMIRLALLNEPKILLLDEPSNGMDVKTVQNLMNFIKYLQINGHTIIIITHDKSFFQISENTIFLN